MKNSTLLKLWQRSLAATSKPHLQQLSGLSSQSRIGLGKKHQQHDTGFTLIELLILLLIVGILSSIAAPGWLAFINNQRLRTSQSRVYGALQLAQSNAKRDKVAWQASFRTQGTVVQWAIHPATTDPTTLPVSTSPSSAPNVWYSLEDKIAIVDNAGTAPTTLPQTNNIYTAIFNRQGCLVDNAQNECTDAVAASFTLPQRITLMHNDLGAARKCAVVTTLLGAMRTGDDETSCNLNP
ncbi:prepilin-type N-terminal cleavage/methylation domain-containing protein [Kamptonema animale CS-326]|jgi:prepilin-type N-terminal cleavage/methylation domain-containing protein|uniref:prepilin-type N-terminal cleavage/methylation domain-containing protein n=1 Tax=Kamptonema animale TaxID=92934 RepID=UPI00232BEB8D|nr:prepilin-type N-terminal cleavage/methylation domain-containing protein [Kamptonema animale]MDB9510325.1 prepilin-type N-terminal cleavage/methylation domain-containing protein [Kamptonema animale CS-326]